MKNATRDPSFKIFYNFFKNSFKIICLIVVFQFLSEPSTGIKMAGARVCFFFLCLSMIKVFSLHVYEAFKTNKRSVVCTTHVLSFMISKISR